MSSLIDRPVTRRSPRKLKLGQIWRLVFEKNRGFRPPPPKKTKTPSPDPIHYLRSKKVITHVKKLRTDGTAEDAVRSIFFFWGGEGGEMVKQATTSLK